jgi:hypothetical protein
MKGRLAILRADVRGRLKKGLLKSGGSAFELSRLPNSGRACCLARCLEQLPEQPYLTAYSVLR